MIDSNAKLRSIQMPFCNCILQIAYFKARHLFFRFGWKDVKDDCDFILRRYFGGASLPE